MATPSRVSYIWSKELQSVADCLSSNLGRSSIVHDLIDSLDLLDRYPSNKSADDVSQPAIRVRDKDPDQGCRHRGDMGRRALVVAPDMVFGVEEVLTRYHEKQYVSFLLGNGKRPIGSDRSRSKTEERDDEAESSSSSGSETETGYRPQKRRKTEIHGLEHDCPTFPRLAEYALTIAAATLTACQLLIRKEADLAIHWDGGRHHALRNRASGFCYVADVVLGIMLLAKEGKAFEKKFQSPPEGAGRPGSVTDGPEDKSTGEASVRHAVGRIKGLKPPAESDGVVQSHLLDSPIANTERKVLDLDDPDQSRPPVLNGHISPVMPVPKIASIKGRRPRIMYLDLDIHYGDGVAQAFHSPSQFQASLPTGKKPPRPPQVLTLSIHHTSKTFFPPPTSHISLPSENTPHPFTLSVPLFAYPSIKTYSEVWTGCVEPIREAFDPDYVVLQLGLDGLPGDPIGQYGAWGIEGEGGIKWSVDKVRSWGRPLCVLGGGGYKSENAARAWASATATLLGRDIPPDRPVPDHSHFPLYAPSFDMEIPESTVPDENTFESLERARSVYSVLSKRIRDIILAHA